MNETNKIIIFLSLEGAESYTEINYFEGFHHYLNNYIKNVQAIPPFAVDGNVKNKETFLAKVKDRIKYALESKGFYYDKLIKERIYVFCIFDSSKRKDNITTNFNYIQKNLKQYIFHNIIFNEGIELGFLNFHLEKVQKSLALLTNKFGYKRTDYFKFKKNKKLFYKTMEVARLEVDYNLLDNLNKRLLKNGFKNFKDLTDVIEM